MKRTLSIAIALTMSMVSGSGYAGLTSPIEKEFLQLREKRDKALATVAEPINEGYRASLEQLLKRAIAEDDKDSAAKIQFELQSLGEVEIRRSLPVANLASAPELTALHQQLAGTKWRINHDKTFMLAEDGSSTSNWTPRKGHWKIIDATTAELDIGNIRRHEKVTVTQGGTLMTWIDREEDQQHSQVAKKIVPVPSN